MPLQVKKTELKVKDGNEYFDGELLFNVDAQAWATGKRNGNVISDPIAPNENVPSEHNNAKWYSEQASSSAIAAASAALEGNLAPIFASNVTYAAGDYVIYNDGGSNTFFRFTKKHPAGAWIGTDVEAITVDQVLKEVYGAAYDAIVINKPATSDTKIKVDTTNEDIDIALMSDLDYKVSMPLDNGGQVDYGTDGQVLRTRGNGTTVWQVAGTPNQEQTQIAVNNWMNSHSGEYIIPDGNVTTAKLQDGAVTENKLTNALKLKTLKDYATPLMFGAAGDGVTDDTTALLDCAQYCANNNVTLLIPENAVLNIPNEVVVKSVKQIISFGTIKAPNGIDFRYGHTKLCPEWYFSKVIGTLKLGGLKCGLITISYADAVIVYADSATETGKSTAYNTFNMGLVESLSLLGGETGGWINENVFNGGRLKNLTIDGSYSHNHNKFLNNSFESCDIKILHGRHNYILGARFEGDNSILIGEPASNNYIQRTWIGFKIPGERVLPSEWFVDNNGNNYFTDGFEPFLRTYEKEYSAKSQNLPIDSFYINADGTIHSRSSAQYKNYVGDSNAINFFLITNKFNIRNGVGVNIATKSADDGTFFRVRIYLYDSNGDQITTEPEVSPIQGESMTWNSNGYYGFGSINKSSLLCSLAKHNVLSGEDSGVCYASISLNGNAAKDIEYLRCRLTTAYFNKINPFDEDRYTATVAPGSDGVWSDGTMVYNTNSANHLLGWFYNNGAWHELGAYT